MPAFVINSPTIQYWLELIESQREKLLNPKIQMQALLERVRKDIDFQFDENQYKWKPLAEYTVKKKIQIQADPRILHETKEGQGLRLRDAYAQAGEVTDAGLLVYSYPIEKPYAREHQEGITETHHTERDKTKTRKKKKGLSYKIHKELREFDEEFKRKIRE